jgi:hypothetical protein
MSNLKEKINDYRNSIKNSLSNDEINEIDEFINKIIIDHKNLSKIINLDKNNLKQLKLLLEEYMRDNKWQEKH